MKTSSSRMKNKVGAQKGAFIKMKQENMYIYQWLDGLCYVPIIAPVISSNYTALLPSLLFCGTNLGQKIWKSSQFAVYVWSDVMGINGPI